MTCLDTNVILSLRFQEPTAPQVATLLDRLDRVMVCGPVVVELSPRDPGAEGWLSQQGIEIDWTLDQAVWRRVALLHREHALRQRRSGGGAPRRVLTDYLIGAHAEVNGYALCTLNARDYRSFTELTVLVAGQDDS
ncbi:type II toxin-antitoxin system VapC family toxin [Deinococcus koreensis]|uniref:type II toxin-antitoxin system VapC family toxin n=1 Tax=Deinococcus koreensis TaxID=2054903 RepID=UPI0013FDB2EF|nr:type II toxin-antitoxin system VapC family toxin [Deinococcus koreensis]